MPIRVTREVLVPLPILGGYFALALAALVAAPALLGQAAAPLAEGFYRHPAVLVTLHTFVLPWGTGVALGALQQLVPVVFQTYLYSTRLALAALILFGAGALALLSGMARWWTPALALGGVLLPVGVGLALANLLLTLREARGDNVIRPFLWVAGLSLAVVVTSGGLLALNLVLGMLGPSWSAVFHTHALLGGTGWFGALILGVSYHLLPFFGLTKDKARGRLPRWVLGLLGAGVVTGALAALLDPPPGGLGGSLGRRAALLLVAAAVFTFLWDTRALFHPRPRRSHPTLGFVRAGHAYLLALALSLAAVALAPSLARGRIVGALGIVALAGWLTNTVLGYFHRILPFLTWHNKYWDRAKEAGIPTFRQMLAPAPSWVALGLYNAGVLWAAAAVSGGSFPVASLALLGGGALLAAANLLRTWWL